MVDNNSQQPSELVINRVEDLPVCVTSAPSEASTKTPSTTTRDPHRVSKRLRYEVLRRDGHRCRYCGGASPDVALTVDHVLPVALGGQAEPGNLVTACKDCNEGKSASAPDSALVADVSVDAIRWARARDYAANRLRDEDAARLSDTAKVLDMWSQRMKEYCGATHLPITAEASVYQWMRYGLSGLDMAVLIDMAVIPRIGRIPDRKLWNYFAGCCWGRLRAIDTAAQSLIEAEEAIVGRDSNGLDVGWMARGLLSYFRDLAAGQAVTVDDLIHESSRDDPEAIRSALSELEAAGCTLPLHDEGSSFAA